MTRANRNHNFKDWIEGHSFTIIETLCGTSNRPSDKTQPTTTNSMQYYFIYLSNKSPSMSSLKYKCFIKKIIFRILKN